MKCNMKKKNLKS